MGSFAYRGGVFVRREAGGFSTDGWTEEEALSFVRRVEEIADEELAKAALEMADTVPPVVPS